MQQQQQQQLYRKPNSGLVNYIWNEAGIPDECDEETIKIMIDVWSIWHAQLELNDINNMFSISWISPNGHKIITDYNTFHKWILCAAIRVQSQKFELV